MALNTHTCGISPCTDLALDIVDRLGWQVLGLLALVVLVFPNALMIGYRMMKSNTTLPLERALYSKHRRFGVEYPCTDAPFHEEYASFKEAGSLRRRALTGMVSV